MNINLHVEPAEGRIDVLGEFNHPADHSQVVEDIENMLRNSDRLEIIFYDALTLPRELIEVLAAEVLRGKTLKILAYHTYLSHVLSALSLPVTHMQPCSAMALSVSRPRAVAIGGSTDSLDKILYMVEHLPKSGPPLFIVQHIGEDAENRLDRLLRIRTDYRVVMPSHLCKVEEGTIYIAPPGYHLKVANGMIYLTHDAKVNYARPSIDVLFKSISREYGKELLGILLCGMNNDGVAGIQTMREAGATILLEESGECSASYLTDQAYQAGAYDYVLGIREMTSLVASAIAGEQSEISEQLIDTFLEALNARYGYDYRGYQYGTVRRRIDKLMCNLDIDDFYTFQCQILTSPSIFQHFYLEMSIEVTSFFRHPWQFRRLREEILPYLGSFPQLKIWSAGCASGEEVYSLALLLEEVGLLERSQIFATDINRFATAQAKSGLFPLKSLEHNRENYLASGGTHSFDSYVENNGLYLKMADRYRKHILFYQHSLAHDGVFNEFQLIFCRNVLIYFRPQQQQQVMERLARSLHPDGFLVLGKSEGLLTGQGERFFNTFDSEGQICRFK